MQINDPPNPTTSPSKSYKPLPTTYWLTLTAHYPSSTIAICSEPRYGRPHVLFHTFEDAFIYLQTMPGKAQKTQMETQNSPPLHFQILGEEEPKTMLKWWFGDEAGPGESGWNLMWIESVEMKNEMWWETRKKVEMPGPEVEDAVGDHGGKVDYEKLFRA